MIKLNLCIFDTDLELIGVIDTISKLEITNNLNTPSTLDLTMILTPHVAELLNVDNYIMLETEAAESANLFIIEYKNITLSNQGFVSIEVKGRDLISILERRVLTKQYNESNTPADDFISGLISNEIITAVDNNRNINNLIYKNNGITIPLSYSNDQLYINLGTAISQILQPAGLGIEILYNFNSNKFIIQLFEGTNRSLTQEVNDPVIFSNELNNIQSESFLHTKKTYITTCYVYGEIGDEESEEVIIVNNESCGFNRYEGATENDINNLTSSNYSSSFKNIGALYIQNQDLYKCFSAIFNIEDKFLKYKTSFKVGDNITCMSQQWGINEELQITQAVESWSNAGYKLNLKLGKPLPTLSQHLQMLKERRY